MNPQYLNLLRTVMQIGGTFLVSKSIVSEADWTAIMGGILMVVPAVWGLMATRKSAIVDTVNHMPEVAGVITKNSTEGIALANAVQGETVVPAGTVEAKAVATADPLNHKGV